MTLIALMLATTGCFDMESEVKVLVDGSGFVTVWVRMPERTAIIGAASMGSTLTREKAAVLNRLDKVFYEREGVELLERVILTQGDHLVLRYRYSFDTPRDLNRFWVQPENAEQDVTLKNGRLAFATTGEGCGTRYETALALPPVTFESMNRVADDILGQQSPEARRALIEEYYKGRFRLRLVVPGKVVASDAPQVDTGGNPMWESNVLELYRNGLTAKATSHVDCGDEAPRTPAADETPPLPAPTLTEGVKPTIPDVLAVLGQWGDLLSLELDATVGRRSSLAVAYRIDSRVDSAVESLLLTVIGTLPTIAGDWDWSRARDQKGRLVLTLRTKKPLRLDKTGSSMLFAGTDGGLYVFRLKLPALVPAGTQVPEHVGPVMLRVSVKMPGEIRRTNATFLEDGTARWVLTARDLRGPVTLEAISEK
ncbi:MAG: hypothetical protein P9L99_20460 [Candidatus Lernaella stagnicola]|nr:hypothetical protein [Candidatus Lernaella stagnicola]